MSGNDKTNAKTIKSQDVDFSINTAGKYSKFQIRFHKKQHCYNCALKGKVVLFVIKVVGLHHCSWNQFTGSRLPANLVES